MKFNFKALSILALSTNAIKVKTRASLYDGTISLAEALSSSSVDLNQE
jgi:hypothetical protein